tara:strand:- start:51 stop:1295 length:1245 start_codon:yes stop_codon:yes gene_type:complete
MYCIIPIFKDPFLHPLHKDNGLSALWCQVESAEEPFFIIEYHPDSDKFMEDYKWLDEEWIVTPDKKILNHFYEFKDVWDLNFVHWLETGKPFENNVRNNAIDFLSNKFYNVKKLNEIIPLSKHNEYCSDVNKVMNIPHTGDNNDYMNDVIKAFTSIEKNGIKVSDDVCDIFDIRVKKHISNGKLYSQYNLWTTTGRPSNSFGSVNFAALPPEKRKAFVPENNSLIEFDFDAYHLRIISQLVKYDFGKDSVHKHLAEHYECSYEESKQRTFKLLYGGIDKETREKVPFFDKVHNYINKKWSEINTHNCVYTDIYRRKLLFKNYKDMNRNKVFNYLIQAYETESNIKKILLIQDYLLGKKTKLVLYGYDSFLFDFANEDGVKTLRDIKSILEENKHYTKSKMGLNYGEMEDITKRL